MEIPQEEYDVPMNEGKIDKTPLPPLPELTMLDATITNVEYRFKTFQGQQVYKKDDSGKDILDLHGNKIPQKEYNITFSIKGHSLPNGDPRKAWLSLNASIFNSPDGRMSKLSAFLRRLEIATDCPTPRVLINTLVGRNVRFMMVTKLNGKQAVNPDSIRLGDSQKPLTATKKVTINEIVWKD